MISHSYACSRYHIHARTNIFLLFLRFFFSVIVYVPSDATFFDGKLMITHERERKYDGKGK